MKRFAVAALLVMIVVIAFFAIKNLSLYNQPGGLRLDSQTKALIAGGHSINDPAFGSLGMGPSVPMITFPGSGEGPPVLSQGQIDKVFHDWTYPGAVDATREYVPPGMSPEQQAVLFGRYTRFLNAYAPPAKVFAFYAAKGGSKPMPATYFPRSSPLAAAPRTSSFVSATYSKLAKDYFIEVGLTYSPSENHTRIILRLAPRPKSAPAGPGLSAMAPKKPKGAALE